MMPDRDLTALVPVDVHIAHDKKRWTKMPFDPLMARLREKTGGQVIQADQDLPTVSKDDPHAKVRVVEADDTIEVEGAGGVKLSRKLYFDYYLAF